MSIVGQVIEFIVVSLVYAACGMPFALVAVHYLTKVPRRHG